ncbi:type I-F CRISPR-associated endoribonuclease Cas6/Csy4 [Selenomonas sp. TAMA-11512]|uniref:type I-F CRISPR-associated endoribonuclease Cas6/Csy4 n=1 Tax=Selenomonas sp. TAMA-11512 TaxID=3095337 RepID=UPI003084B0AE|nr:type I-F CRISPR-associated endoribonuclease Cas6/Csy4 [Selenomonas sp. TAMA-11512]
MQFYQELTLLTGAEISIYHLWSKVYQQLHIGLAELLEDGRGEIGVSFPEYQESGEDRGLGMKLRVFSKSEEILERLDLKKQLRRFDDYVHITGVRPIPVSAVRGHAVYCRCHSENSQRQKARRYAKRHDIEYEEALELFPKDNWKGLAPYIQLQSLSTGRPFRLHIVKQEASEICDNGFGAYGLDNASTVPEF